jgi:hypothetical protein
MILIAFITFPDITFSQINIINQKKDNSNYYMKKQQLNSNTSLASKDGEYILQSDGTQFFVSTKELLEWCQQHNVAVYSKHDYDEMNDVEKSEVDNLSDKIIYSSDKIKASDVYAYKYTKN